MVRRTASLGILLGACAILLIAFGASWRRTGPDSEIAAAPPLSAVTEAQRADAALAEPTTVAASSPIPVETRAAVLPPPLTTVDPESFVAGRVVDDLGAPVAGAAVRVEIAWPDGAQLSLETESDAEGRFAFDGSWEGASKATLHARAEGGYLDAEVRDVVPRSLDATLVLERGGWIAGSLLGDEWVDFAELRVLVDQERETGRSEVHSDVLAWHRLIGQGLRGEHEVRPEPDAAFRVGPVRAGTWTVRIARSDDPSPLAEGQCEGGSALDDPLLAPIVVVRAESGETRALVVGQGEYIVFRCGPTDGRVRAAGGRPLDDAGQALYELGEPGRYRVSWRLFAISADGGAAIRDADWQPLESIEVADQPGEQVIAVHLDAERMRRLRGLPERGK